MSILGILAAMAGIAVIYMSWTILKFIFTFFVKIFVFIGMVSFAILMFLIFIGSTLTWLADAKQQKERQINSYPNQTINHVKQPVRQQAYGIPIPGRKGLIRSPYINKVIDVRGHAPNTIVTDPYTEELIIVP